MKKILLTYLTLINLNSFTSSERTASPTSERQQIKIQIAKVASEIKDSENYLNGCDDWGAYDTIAVCAMIRLPELRVTLNQLKADLAKLPKTPTAESK